MKTTLPSVLLAFAVLGAATAALAHPGKKTAGPNGGRILLQIDPPAELFVTTSRHVQFTFLDDHGRPVPPAGQAVTMTTGSRTAPTVLTFRREGDVLRSETALPAGNNLPAVIQFRPNAEAPETVVRLNLNLAVCRECRHAEYACTCEDH